RVNFYARRIRILGALGWNFIPWLHSNEAHIHPMLLAALISRRFVWELGPLLPNLAHLNLDAREFTGLAWFPRLVVGPQLKSVVIDTSRTDLEVEEYQMYWGNIFASLSIALPTIKSFTLSVKAGFFTPEDSDIYTFPSDVKVPLKMIRTTLSPTVL